MLMTDFDGLTWDDLSLKPRSSNKEKFILSTHMGYHLHYHAIKEIFSEATSQGSPLSYWSKMPKISSKWWYAINMQKNHQIWIISKKNQRKRKKGRITNRSHDSKRVENYDETTKMTYKSITKGKRMHNEIRWRKI